MSSSRLSGKQQRQFSILGLAALIGGATLIYLYYDLRASRSEETHAGKLNSLLTEIIYFGTGSILLLWGTWATLSDLWPAFGRLFVGKKRRYRVKMPVEAMVYLLFLFTLFMGSLLGRSNILMLVFGMMAGPFVFNGWITFAMLKRTEAWRKLPDRAIVGDVISVEVHLENRKRLFSSWMVVLQDQLRSSLENLRPAVLFTRVPPKSERVGNYQVRFMHRGVYQFGPIQVASRFPLGLMERAVVVDQMEELVVYPRVGRLTAQWQRQNIDSSELVRQFQARKGTFDDEFHRLREYRTGDNPRAIHWRTSARRNELMVREFHQERDQNLMVIVDLWTPPRPSSTDLERVELAISFAATVCVEYCQLASDSKITLGNCGDGTALLEGPGNGFSIDPILERLAIAKAGPATQLATFWQETSALCGTHTRKILVTTRLNTDRTIQNLYEASSTPDGFGTASAIQIVEADPHELTGLIQFES